MKHVWIRFVTAVTIGGLGVVMTGNAIAAERNSAPTQAAPAKNAKAAVPANDAPVTPSTTPTPQTPTASAPTATPPTMTPAAGSAASAAAEQAKAKEDAARAAISGTKWSLELTPISGGDKVKPVKDTISFDDRQITSDRLSKSGYPASNYTLTVQADGTVIWETMQTKEGEGVAFWRGEVHDSTMRGVLSKHSTEGATEDYTINGQQSGKATPSASKASSATSGSTPQPSSSTSGTDTSGSKKSKKKNKKD